MCIHKKPAANLAENQIYDKALARLRVRSEHCMGGLKNRWSCLKGLRIAINSKEDHIRACHWITIAIILHNAIIDIEGTHSTEVFASQNMDGGPNEQGSMNLEPEYIGPEDEAGEAKRQKLVAEIVAFRNYLKL